VKSPLDELYLTWLYGQVANVNETDPSQTYWGLFKQLYTTEFVWLVPHDDNRIEDGKHLRLEFAGQLDLDDIEPGWVSLGCSMLELYLGLARRLSFQAGGEARIWFSVLIRNTDLHMYNDTQKFPGKEVSEILDRIIWRKYNYNGHGGLFPLNEAIEDQREIELWYQMHSYLNEHC
jgi:hypothetical protein